MKIIDEASRCFNCGSYSHSLKKCPKPCDNATVNNARQQQKSRRNQNSVSHNPARYYQNSSGEKYDGLMPGALDAETRRLLGLGVMWLLLSVLHYRFFMNISLDISGLFLNVDKHAHMNASMCLCFTT